MNSIRTLVLGLLTSAFLPVAAVAATALDIDGRTNASNTTDRSVSANFQSLTLSSGVYRITPIDRGAAGGFTALNVWNNVRGCDGAGTGCSQGWLWILDVISDGDNLMPSKDTAGTSSRFRLTSDVFSTAGAAFADADANGPALFKLLANDTVHFGLTDTPVTDNIGGVSFDLERVSAAVPVPLPAALLLGGVAMLGAVRSRRG